MHEVEKEAPTEKVNPKLYATIIDGMALIRKQKTKGKTFECFSDEMIASAIESNQSSKRIDIVFDVYRDSSIKMQRGSIERSASYNSNVSLVVSWLNSGAPSYQVEITRRHLMATLG